MGKINVLGFEVANLIAAGEVVDRPSSVVKELLENAIDSGANQITIEIKNGGTTFIRIADNGSGIEFDDLPVAILRHATSKIKNASDLDSIFTLGFRGEALAAISSVSKIRIMSKPKNADFGGLLEAHGGEILNHIKTGCAEGTTVIVEDLFYNVPARKKFLKKDMTEAIAISSVVEKIAMSKPNISFRYIIDGNLKYLTAGDGNLSNVIYALLGRDVAKKSIKVAREDNGISVEGYISSPELTRNNRNSENFYINSRFVKSKTASAALEQAFCSYIPSDKFPFCSLNIEINPSLVDVNVHPSKLEVKFSNEKLIFDAVYYAVRGALENSVSRPQLYDEPTYIDKAKELVNTPFPVRDREISAPKPERIVFDTNSNFATVRSNNTLDYSGMANTSVAPPSKPEPHRETITFETTKAVPQKPTNFDEGFDFTYNVPKDLHNYAKTEEKTVPDYKIIGEAFNTYVIVELGDIMYLIDKHAAHERIIFEDLKKKIKDKEPSSQILMIPIEANLSIDELSVLNEWQDEIKKTGFDFVEKGGAVSIIEIPTGIETGAARDMFITFLDNLINSSGFAKETRDEFFEKALYQASCKAAIKAGRVYDKEDIKWIVDKVLCFDNIKYCPHGRAVAFEVTKHFLEKQFERIK